MSKIQNLKAIHNGIAAVLSGIVVVSDVKDTKFESNSQLRTFSFVFASVVSDVKDTKFESNSQLIRRYLSILTSCF